MTVLSSHPFSIYEIRQAWISGMENARVLRHSAVVGMVDQLDIWDMYIMEMALILY